MAEGFAATPLHSEHRTGYLDCGVGSLDRWLDKQALKDQELGRSRTHVWADEEDIVVAYFTLLQTVVSETDDDQPFFKKLRPRHYPDMSAPGVLLGKLALNQQLRGSGVDLLADAYMTAYEAVRLIGGVFFVVDPADHPKVHDFYVRSGFKQIPGTKRMFLNFDEFNEGAPL
ncbi:MULTISPECIES: hypothetical protein [Gordonia]|uniref:GNAT family N-acetyltransferase n=2 Tax=Gordonia TaxID=2053 RepID=A0ABR5I9K1_9ACTN|nr:MULTISPECIES: hypothetical protein [Gordonia]KNA90071.1 hypothetical protein ABW18_16775 [Gordonia jacobaea]GAC47607.1 putative acetyltransferase [Gordonia aichiensis NBRC 108223]